MCWCHCPSVRCCVPPRRLCPVFGPCCRTWQTGEREGVQAWSACLDRRPLRPALLSLKQGRLRRQLDVAFSLLKGKGWENGCSKGNSSWIQEKKLLFSVVKHWNRLWEVLEPSSLETSGTLPHEDLSSLLISSLQCQRQELCVCSFFLKKPSGLLHLKKILLACPL